MPITSWKVALPVGSCKKTDHLKCGSRRGWVEFVTVCPRSWRKRFGALEVAGELTHSNFTQSWENMSSKILDSLDTKYLVHDLQSFFTDYPLFA